MGTEERAKSSGNYSSVGGSVGGHNVVGDHATASGGVVSPVMAGVGPEDVRRRVEQLRNQVETKAPIEKRSEALKRVEELEAAVTTETPDRKTLTKMEYIRDWFGDNLPEFAGAVFGLIVHPIVGKVVEAVGEGLASEYRRRFTQGGEQPI